MTTNESTSGNSEIDTSRAPLGVKAASALVRAVAASDDRVERHYLEVKSDLDLDLSKKNDIAKIAKYILGSANRLPHVANKAFEGYGVMIIGVASGDARGVPPIEVLDLDKVIRTYIGASGPEWDVVRVPISGSDNEVLVLVVDPPQDGQDLFPCRREGESLFDGRIYIRADGATREAKADEIDLLIKRGKHQPEPDVSFKVEVAGFAHPVLIDDDLTVDSYIDGVKARLIAALPSSQAASLDARSHSVVDVPSSAKARQLMNASQAAQKAVTAAGFTSEPEPRTEEEYRRSIDEWEERVRSEWQPALDELASYALEGVAVRVSNETKTYFHDVEVRLHLEGDVRGIDWRNGSDELGEIEIDISSPPRKWGRVTRSPYDFSLTNPAQYMSGFSPPSTYQSPLDWNNSGSVDLTLDVGDLRPLQPFASDRDELILVLPVAGATEVRGTWAITARDHNEIYVGELFVAVGDPLNLTGAVRELLDLD